MAPKKRPLTLRYHTITTAGAAIGCSAMTVRNYVQAGTVKPDALTLDDRPLFLPATVDQLRKLLTGESA